MQRQFFSYVIVTLKGMAMGAADVVPGVSGGTIAFISGIYEELIESLDNINLETLKIWRRQGFIAAWKSINGNFLLALFTGIAISIVTLAKLIEWLLKNKPILLWAFFFGLVLASIFYVAKQIKTWNITITVALILASVLSYLITLVEPFASPESPVYLLFCGFIAIIAMILPGVSGAFILLILGAYQTAIDTVNNLSEGIIQGNFEQFKGALSNFLLLVIGAIVGIKVFSRALNWMFKHHKNLTLAILTGFIIGSLNKIWPWKQVLKTWTNKEGEAVTLIDKSILPNAYPGDAQLPFAILLIVIGFLTILILERIGNKKPD